MGKTYDFSGWATKNDIRCSDGRTIRRNAFAENDGQKVPLVWNHQHNDVENVLGHALLENRNEGVYAYCSFNDTRKGREAKEQVMHGDITALSIYANKLRQNGGDVIHGCIREVSLVLAGANVGAMIDSVMAHGEMSDEEAVIYTGEMIELTHSDETDDSNEPALNHADKENNMTEENKKPNNEEEETVKEVFDTLTDKQKTVVYALIGQALADAEKKNNKSEGDDEKMKHNAFEDENMQQDNNVLSHSEMMAIIDDAKRYGSLKESVLQHGITNVEYLFPDAHNLTNEPGFLTRNPDGWVAAVMNGVHKTPFSRIKMMFADLREDDARAKGYATKGALKKEEVFGLLKRTVEPTTVYKMQKMDRDDVIDITDFDVIAWLKREMRMMLDEEIARAILFGDGRSTSSPDKIDPTKIIPIVSDAALYTIPHAMAAFDAEDFIDACVLGQVNYEGSGNTTLFVGNTQLTQMLLVKDTNKHRIYKDVNDLALACAVKKIQVVPDAIVPADTYGLIVDLNDYNVGADKGGSVNMFDDFDLNYNKMEYLIETRCSGALTKPFSAVVIKKQQAAG